MYSKLVKLTSLLLLIPSVAFGQPSSPPTGTSTSLSPLVNFEGRVIGNEYCDYTPGLGSATLVCDGMTQQYGDDDGIFFGDDPLNDGIIKWKAASDALHIDTLGSGKSVILQDFFEIDDAGHMGWAGTAPAINYIVNLDSSGSDLRGALSFVYEFIDTASLGLNIYSAVDDNTTSGLALGMAFLGDSKLSTNSSGSSSYGGYWTRIGIDNALVLNTGTNSFAGLKVEWGLGNANASSTSGATVYRYGVQVPSFPALNGAIVYETWALNAGEAIQVNDDVKLALGGSNTTLSTTFFLYDSTDTDLELEVDGTAVADFDNDQVEYHVTVAGGRNLFSAIASTTVAMSTTYADITWTEQIEDDYYTHAASASGIQFDADGLYRVHFDFWFENTTATTLRALMQCHLQEDVGAGYVDIANSECSNYTRPTADDTASCSVELLRSFSNTDDIKAECKINSASATGNIDPVGTRMNIEFLRN